MVTQRLGIITIRCTAEVQQALAAIAAAEQRSVSNVGRLLLEKAIGERATAEQASFHSANLIQPPRAADFQRGAI